METLCEEIYHAMEDYIVTNMNWNLSVIDTQYFQELCDWKENFENYTSYDYDKYVSQPLEASAKKYAKEEINDHSGSIWKAPMMDKVSFPLIISIA